MKSFCVNYLLISVMCLISSIIYAEDEGTAKQKIIPTVIESKTRIDEILAGREFHNIQLKSGYEAINDTTNEDTDNEQNNQFLRNLLLFLAESFEIIIWIFLIAICCYIISRYQSFLPWMSPSNTKAKKVTKPSVLFGLEVNESTLPKDIPTHVLSLWNNERKREALSLLYRATLSRLIHQYSMHFSVGNTEQECYQLVNQNESCSAELTQYVKRLTQSWQKLAYGHEFINNSTLEKLCSEWTIFFKDENNHA